MSKKIGLHDLDPDVLNYIMSSVGSGGIQYNDKPLKDKLDLLQRQLNELKTNGSSNSFNKYADKVTEGMLSPDLLEAINKAIKAVDGSGDSQQIINGQVKEEIENLYRQCQDEANDRKEADNTLSDDLQELLGLAQSLKNMADVTNQDIEDAKNVATNTMVGATSTTDGVGGAVPAPLMGQQDCVLTGGAKWIQQSEITAGKATCDSVGNDITGYIATISFNPATKTLSITRGDGNTTTVDLS